MIVQSLADSFTFDLVSGLHLPTDLYRIALYTADADLGPTTSAYTTKGEVVGDGYIPGGQLLKEYQLVRDQRVAMFDWADPVWPRATITARGALIYNFSKGNRALGVLDMGKSYSSTNGNFMVTLPEPTTKTALIRIRG